MPSDPKRCSWDEEGDGCGLVNFQTTVGLEILEYEGRDYCLLHLHLKAKRDKYTVQPNSLSQIFHQLQIAGATDFRGVQLPGFPHNVLQTYSIQRPIMMRNAVFGDWVRLTFENVGCDLSGSIFEGVTDIDNLSNQQEVSLRQCKFLGRLKVDAGNSRFAIDFTKSEFCERARFSQVDSLESLLFAGCRFAYAPEFSSEVKLPPKTSFDRAEFTVRAEDESAYRTIRNAFATPRARDAEGRFYAYEKQAQRMSLRRDHLLALRQILAVRIQLRKSTILVCRVPAGLRLAVRMEVGSTGYGAIT